MEENRTSQLIAKTLYGLEDVLAQELKEIGAENIEVARRMVSFCGDKGMMYKANVFLRTALRILKPIATFEANDADEVYQYLYDNINWFDYLDSRTTFAFDTVVYSEKFTHSKFVAYRGKDALCDYFTDHGHKRPNVSVVKPSVTFHIHISHTTVTLALDSSGDSLHKRGYRVSQNDAPISEVLAAAILLKAGWRGESDFIDPMCGSGTFLTEAALIALNIPPGIFKQHYAFERWKDFDQELLSEVLDDWEERPFEHTIYGSDISPKAISIARANIKQAGVQKYVQLSVKDLVEYTSGSAPSEGGLIVTNPPYGERLRESDIEQVYGTLGSVLKHTFSGYKAWVISSSEEGFDAVGLKHFHREKLINGSIECELRGYELFDGKRNDFVRERVERGDAPSYYDNRSEHPVHRPSQVRDAENRRGGRRDRDTKPFRSPRSNDGGYGGSRDNRRDYRSSDRRDDRRDYRSNDRRDDRRDYRSSDRRDDRRDYRSSARRDDRSYPHIEGRRNVRPEERKSYDGIRRERRAFVPRPNHERQPEDNDE